VLDSWVRYEAQERESEQRQLTESVIQKVAASLAEDKTQKQILDNAFVQLERTWCLHVWLLMIQSSSRRRRSK